MASGNNGRNDEELASVMVRILKLCNRGLPHMVIWADNCTAQNKNWTMYSSLAAFVGEETVPTLQTATIKYFEAGHMFMSADSFHARCEEAMKK